VNINHELDAKYKLNTLHTVGVGFILFHLSHINIYFMGISFGVWSQWCKSWEWKLTPKKFWLVKDFGNEISTYFSNVIEIKVRFIVAQCTNKSLSCHTKDSKYISKINKPSLVTSCLNLCELMSNWLTWKFGQKKHFVL